HHDLLSDAGEHRRRAQRLRPARARHDADLCRQLLADAVQAAPAGGGAVHLHGAQDQFDAGAYRCHRRRVLRYPRGGNGVPDFDRGRPYGRRPGLGGNRGRGGRGFRLLCRDSPHREGRHILASVRPWWAGIGRKQGSQPMKKLLSIAVIGAVLAGTVSAQAADKVTLELKWVTQAQFAGYYVAKAKGYYSDAGLDVTINPSGTDVTPVQTLAAGGADVIIDWLADALSAREKGVQLVNIAQPYKNSGLWMTCRKDMGVTSTADFKGKTLGVWFGGNEYPFYAWMAKLGDSTDGGANGVTVLKQGFDVNPLLQKQAACVSTMSYNEYGQVLDGGLKPDQLTVFNYRDEGVGMLEDGLY